MTDYAVTSFAPDGWKQYGKRFVDTFLQNWPIPLVVFAEGQPAPDGYRGMRDLIWYDLKNDPEHEEFCRKYAGPEFNSRTDFNEMSVKFCHKVFAITSPKLPKIGWRVWVDADSETVRPVEQQHLANLLPANKALTYLGRTGWMRKGQPMYTECGFVGYNLRFEEAHEVLAEMRWLYTSGELFKQGRHNWHDSYAFDYAKKYVKVRDDLLNNVSAHLPPQSFHPWPDTILGEVMVHNKGPKRKRAAYG